MSTIINDIKLLHPQFRRTASEMIKILRHGKETGLTKTSFEIFETFRHPKRQGDLLAKGVSKVGAFASAHQFGLAVDFVPYLSPDEARRLAEAKQEVVHPGWNWDSSHDYDFLRQVAERCGAVVPISWDRVHVEHPRWREFLNVFKTTFGP